MIVYFQAELPDVFQFQQTDRKLIFIIYFEKSDALIVYQHHF